MFIVIMNITSWLTNAVTLRFYDNFKHYFFGCCHCVSFRHFSIFVSTNLNKLKFVFDKIRLCKISHYIGELNECSSLAFGNR